MKKTYFSFYFIFALNKFCFSQDDGSVPLLFYQSKIDSLNTIKPSFARDTNLIYYYNLLLTAHSVTDLNRNKIKTEFENFKKIALNTNWPRGKAMLKFHTAGESFFQKKEIVGLRLMLETEKDFEKAGDISGQLAALSRIIAVLGNNVHSLSAESYIIKHTNLAKKTNDATAIEVSLNSAGDFYMQREKWTKALRYFLKIKTVRKTYKKRALNIKSYQINHWVNELNIGMCYLNMNREELGLPIVENVLKELPMDVSFTRVLFTQVSFDLVNYYLKKSNYVKAEKYLKRTEQVLKINPSISSTNDKYKFEKLYFQINKHKGNFKEALSNLERFQVYNDTLLARQMQNKIDGFKSELKLKSESQKREKAEKESLKAAYINKNYLQWTLIVGSILSLLSLLYVVKTNKTLKQKNDDLANKFDEILAAHLAGQTTERQRVALDLHDNLGSTISSIKYSLEAIDRSKMNADEVAVQENLYSLLDKAYNDVRLLSNNLLPEEFEKQGLAETLKLLVKKMNKSSKIDFDLQIDENFGRVDKKVEFELYSICLELITNIQKHSKATEAKISLLNTGKQISLTVSDNGIGVFKNESDGKGMKNVQARVDSINGKWTVKSVEGEGVVNEILV